MAESQRTAVPRQPAGARPGDVVTNPLAAGRETVESVVVAFTLALLFRCFEAEAFVIPTGSMAPTLMGRHKDLACEACGETYRVGCSQELDEASGTINPERMVPAGVCPNCTHETRLMAEMSPRGYDRRHPTFGGDRILVDKLTYDFAEPKRWDVVVFKYPEDAKINYIKRLIGLPGETVHVVGGDIWISRDGGQPAIARKPADKLLAMLQCVSDSDHVRPDWPQAWCDWRSESAPGCGWSTADEGRSFSASCAEGETATLRYRHFDVSDEARLAARRLNDRALRDGGAFVQPAGPPLPTRVDDFQPYNGTMVEESRRPSSYAFHHPVGDLAVEARVESRSAGGRVGFDLVDRGLVHRCLIDLADGRARLLVAGRPDDEAASAATPVRGPGTWRIVFANVDDELSLFVDGRRIATDRPTSWDVTPSAAPPAESPPALPGSAQPTDLAPAGISATGADVTVRHLKLWRDTYYIGMKIVKNAGGRLQKAVSEDSGDAESDDFSFRLDDDQFLMLGDNSASSKDSRLWLTGHAVDRRLLIGRALVVFWPHAIPADWSVTVLRWGGWELRLPCWPNFGRMRVVR